MCYMLLMAFVHETVWRYNVWVFVYLYSKIFLYTYYIYVVCQCLNWSLSSVIEKNSLLRIVSTYNLVYITTNDWTLWFWKKVEFCLSKANWWRCEKKYVSQKDRVFLNDMLYCLWEWRREKKKKRSWQSCEKKKWRSFVYYREWLSMSSLIWWIISIEPYLVNMNIIFFFFNL